MYSGVTGTDSARASQSPAVVYPGTHPGPSGPRVSGTAANPIMDSPTVIT